MTSPAKTRGSTRYWTGFTAMTSRASICSVTRMVPISAAMDEPARPVTMSAVMTGPNSRVMDRATVAPTRDSAENMRKAW